VKQVIEFDDGYDFRTVKTKMANYPAEHLGDLSEFLSTVSAVWRDIGSRQRNAEFTLDQLDGMELCSPTIFKTIVSVWLFIFIYIYIYIYL